MKNLEISLLFDTYGEYLSDKQREVFDFYYNEDFSLSEIAEHTGMTRQGVRDWIKRTEQQLIELEEKLGFNHKVSFLKEQASLVKAGRLELQNLLDTIEDL